MKRRMKRNKLLKKVLTLGLAAAVAVTSMAPTLGMLEPVVAYADETDEDAARSVKITYADAATISPSLGDTDASIWRENLTHVKSVKLENNKITVEANFEEMQEVTEGTNGKKAFPIIVGLDNKVSTCYAFKVDDEYVDSTDTNRDARITDAWKCLGMDRKPDDWENDSRYGYYCIVWLNDEWKDDETVISFDGSNDYTIKVVDIKKMEGKLELKKSDDSELSELTDENTIIGTTVKADGITEPTDNITYKWYRVDDNDTKVEIENVTGDSYELTNSDVGYYIKVVASADGYEEEEVTTAHPVDKKPFAGNSITGGSYDPDTKKLTFTLIATVEADALEYTLNEGDAWVKGDAGSALSVNETTITISLDDNTSYPAGSIKVRFAETDDTKAGDAVAYDTAIKATLAGTVTLSGTFKVGETITATVSGIQESAKANLRYQFMTATNGGIEGNNLTKNTIDTPTSTNTLILTKEQLNMYITVEVTNEDYDGKIVQTNDDIKTNSVVEKGDAFSIQSITGERTDGTTKDTWKYTINAVDTEGDVKYKKVVSGQSADDVVWGETNVFDNITPGTNVTFYAYISGENCGREDSAVVSETVAFPYKTHTPLNLNYTVADDGEGKKVTIDLSGLTAEDLEVTFNGGSTWTDAEASQANEHTYTADELSNPATFGIRYKQNDAYGTEPMGAVMATVDLNKGVYAAPELTNIEFVPNAAKTAYVISEVTVTTSEGINVEYSTDGAEGSFTNLDTVKAMEFAASEEVTIYARVAGDDDNNPSPVVSINRTTNPASTAPTITLTPGSGAVIAGTGTIYYTTDGTDPGVGSTTYSGPITTSAGMVIKAIAVEEGKIKSSITTETIPSTTGGNTEPDPSNPSGGNSGTTPSNPSTGSGSGSSSSGGSTSGGSTSGSTGGTAGTGTTGGTGTTPTPSTPTVTTTPDGTVVSTNKDGAYVDKNGNVAADTLIKDSTGAMHVTDSTGHITKDDVVTTADGTTYVVGAEGNVVVSDIAEIKGNKYVADENGVLVTSAFSSIGGDKYYSDAEGVVKTDGFFNAAGKKYYADEDGVIAVKELVTVNGKKYFATKTGVIATKKIVTTGGKKYFATKSGVIATKKVVKTGGKKYFATKDGSLATNKWVKSGNKKYFCNKKGVITKTKKVK